MIKILAYKYPSIVDVAMQRTVKPMHFSILKTKVQNAIKQLLFEEKYNYLLIGLDGKLYVCEATNLSTKEYSRREIGYHPAQHEVI